VAKRRPGSECLRSLLFGEKPLSHKHPGKGGQPHNIRHHKMATESDHGDSDLGDVNDRQYSLDEL
jgi:hypothetical protein